MILYLLSGWARSGKDYVATTCFPHAHRLAFADALKVLTATETGLELRYFYDDDLKDKPVDPTTTTTTTPRDLLLAVAKRARAEDLDVFSKSLVQAMDGMDSGVPIVVTDWRYRREYEFLRANMPPNYKIVRCRVVREPAVTPSDDPSEHDLDGVEMDWILYNRVPTGPRPRHL